jgi:hemolysin activation/secretion protein
VKQVLCLLLLIVSTPVLADAYAQIRQLESELLRLQQEEQATHQQFLMIQELRRNEMQAPPPPPPNASAESIPIPKYEDQVRFQQEKHDRIEKYTADLDHLYSRFQALEDERQIIVEQINFLEQKPEE